MKKILTCEICGRTGNETEVCNNKASGKVLCARHARQWKNYGKITDTGPSYVRKPYKKNEITINGNIATIKIIRWNGDVVFTTIDAEDVDRVSQYCWHFGDNGYISTSINGKNKYLHRLILCYDGKKEIDHINRNPLDNRKQNLRIVNRTLNSINKNSKGVSYRPDRKKYRAYITVYGKQMFIGYYNTYEEAIDARIKKQKEIEDQLTA